MHENKTPTTLKSSPEDSKRSITETTQNEINNFYKTISEAETKPAILSVMPGYNKFYVPKETMQLPKPLTFLFHGENAKMSFKELMVLCEATKFQSLLLIVITLKLKQKLSRHLKYGLNRELGE